MKTKIFLTMALMAGMMLAGCSKDESSNMEETKGQTEPQDYFEEPILDFTMNLEQIKQRETHPYKRDNEWEPSPDIQNATNPWLIVFDYTSSFAGAITFYGLLDKDKSGIGEIVMEVGQANEKVVQKLTERYGTPMTSRDDVVFTPANKDYTVIIRNQYIIYRPK